MTITNTAIATGLSGALLSDVFDLLKVARMHHFKSRSWQTHTPMSLFEGVELGIQLRDEDRHSLYNWMQERFHLDDACLGLNIALELCQVLADSFFAENADSLFDSFKRNLSLAASGHSFFERADQLGLPLDLTRTVRGLNEFWNNFWIVEAPIYFCFKITGVLGQLYQRPMLPWYPDAEFLVHAYGRLDPAPLVSFVASFSQTLVRQLETAKANCATINDWLRAATGLWIDFEFLIELDHILQAMEAPTARDDTYTKRLRMIEEWRVDLLECGLDYANRLSVLASELDQIREKDGPARARFHLHFFHQGRAAIPDCVFECLDGLLAESSPIHNDPLKLSITKILAFKCSQELTHGFRLAFSELVAKQSQTVQSEVHTSIADQMLAQWDDALRRNPRDHKAHHNRAEVLYWQGRLDDCAESVRLALDCLTNFAPSLELQRKVRAVTNIALPHRKCNEREAIELINAGLACINKEQLDVWLEAVADRADVCFFNTLQKLIEQARRQRLPDVVARLCAMFSLRLRG